MRGEGVSCGFLANEYSCAHHVTWSPNKLWRSNSIFYLCFNERNVCFPDTVARWAIFLLHISFYISSKRSLPNTHPKSFICFCKLTSRQCKSKSLIYCSRIRIRRIRILFFLLHYTYSAIYNGGN
jgi:hypothetical protein